MEYHKVSSSTLSKKLMNGYSFGGKSIYDGVFGGTAKVGSNVVEDYGDIFGGSSSCSIPILDVPELNERKVSVDVSTSELDYSKIFGGFGEFDFAVSHEELSAQPKKRESFIEEAGTTPKTGSHTSNFSVKNQVSSHEDSYQSFDGVKELKMSYHKTNQERKNGINGTTHIAQVHAVPGYTCLIDEVVPLPMNEGNKPSSSVSNDAYHNSSLSGEIMEGKPSWKAASANSSDGAKKQASNDGVKSNNRSNRSRSTSNEMFFDAYDIRLTTHPLKVPPPSTLPHNTGNNKSDSKISVTSKFGMSKNHSSEDAADICSPPYFDEEVDSNSVAAVSTAAVKKAIEEAQARIRIAKEIMERKKNSLQKHVKQRFKDGSKLKEGKQSTITDETNNFREEAGEEYGKVDLPIPIAGLGTQNAVKASQVAPDLEGRDKPFSSKGTLGEMHEITYRTAPMDHRQEKMNDSELREENYATKSFEKLRENSEKLEVAAEAHKQEEIEKKLDVLEGACEMKECAEEPKLGKEVHDREEYGKKLRVARPLEEVSVLFKASHKIEASVKKLRGFQEPTSIKENLEMPELEDNECTKMRILKDEQEWLEKEQKQKEVFKQEENDTRSEDVPKREENEATTEEIFNHKENEEREEAVCERVQFVKQLKEACKAEENDVNCREESEKTFDQGEEQEKIEVRMHDLHGGKKCEKKLNDDGELGVQEKLIEAEENAKMLREGYEMIETERIHKKSCEWMEYEQMQAEIDHRAEDEETITTRVALEHCENNLEVANNVCQLEKIGILSEPSGASGHEKNNVSMETSTHKENREVMGVLQASSGCHEIQTESNAVEVANDLEKKEVSEVEIAGSAQVVFELNEIKNQMKDTTGAHAFEYYRVNLGTADMDVRQKQLREQESEAVCNAGEHVEELACEPEEIFEDAEEVEVVIEKEGDESDFEFSEERWVDKWQTVESTKLPSIFQGEVETTEISHEIKASQNTEKIEENYSKTAQAEERETEGTIQKEGELQKESLRKRDKVKEKEKEREKERMAVERAIREARERAFAEARERAERAAAEKATAEAHRRAMAEARGRLEKASAEANEKISMEARLKAMRAAVERATAEARERALEKAMFEKATLVARNQAVKSSGASRDNGMRPSFASNDSKYRGSEPTRNSGHPNSSNNSVSCSNDKLGVNGESTQRDKASLERDKRTAERAAKALAEKNMRDILARKEQAERNRLAEALDADVKRWSSGKAGNLRALLSTLQYILGPDSGWQPIPLTDLVAAAAVKKAYRKATLVVHPDKLQQRGASIQQKYTCEKVFDLLKDAWNKFSAEE